MSKRGVVGLLLLIGCIVVAYRFTGSDRPSPDDGPVPGHAVSDDVKHHEPPTIAKPASAAPAAAWSSDPRAVAIAGLRAAFDTEPDLRVVFDRALADPASGGIYHAARVLAECARFVAIPEGNRSTPMQSGTEDLRVASRDLAARQVARCHGLGDPPSTAAIDAALRSSIALDDPIEGTIPRRQHGHPVVANPDFDDASALVSRAIAVGDPYFLTEALDRLNRVAGGFDELDLRDAKAGFRDLMVIVTHEARCNLGVACERGAAAVAECVQRGDCGPYAERLGNRIGLTEDERRFVVEAGADIAASARDGTLLGRYRR